MAIKMLKRLGISTKKGSPHPQKSEYCNKKSNSVQDLCGKASTSIQSKTRSHTLSSSSSNLHGHFLGCEENSHKHTFSLLRIVKRRSSVSKATRCKSDVPVVQCISEQLNSGTITPPTLLAEYSDPIDLKKVYKEGARTSIKGSSIVELDTSLYSQDISDDDYTLPYEIKQINLEKRRRDQQLQQSLINETSHQLNEVTAHPKITSADSSELDHQTATNQTESLGLENIDPSTAVNHQISVASVDTSAMQDQLGDVMQQSVLSSGDPRPQQEYEQPWDWSKTSSILFAAGDSEGVGLQPISSHLPSKQTDANQSSDGVDYANTRHNYVNAQVNLIPAKPVAGITEQLVGCQVQLDDESPSRQSAQGGARPKQKCPHTPKTKQHRGPPIDGRIGNYEEPWDLSCTQNILEEAFLCNKIPLPADGDKASTADPQVSQAPTAGQSDTECVHNDDLTMTVVMPGITPPPDNRPQEGYEKPWDWKPHNKDEREQEGYEKPWDWKPHQKDERPTCEYEQPWDQRARNIEQNLLKAKSAKEIKSSTTMPDGSISQAQPNTSQGVSHRTFDSRPGEEYDVPWDNRMAASIMSAAGAPTKTPVPAPRTGIESSQKASQNSHATQSPVKRLPPQPLPPKANSSPSWSPPVPDRVDPNLSLDRQGWYHGAISRVDAQRLLGNRIEGSFLVRMSESNKRDFSLTLKSARGFMHMKIVHKGGNFILGQFSQPFESIPKMIHHYSLNKLPIKGAEHMSLLHPVMHELL